MVIFHCYVSSPEGSFFFQVLICNSWGEQWLWWSAPRCSVQSLHTKERTSFVQKLLVVVVRETLAIMNCNFGLWASVWAYPANPTTQQPDSISQHISTSHGYHGCHGHHPVTRRCPGENEISEKISKLKDEWPGCRYEAWWLWMNWKSHLLCQKTCSLCIHFTSLISYFTLQRCK